MKRYSRCDIFIFGKLPRLVPRRILVISSSGDRAEKHGAHMFSHGFSTSCLRAVALLRRALPIASFYLTEILVGLTDLAVVGALGTAPLAAVGLSKTILLSFLTVGFAVLSIGTVLMAEDRQPEACGEVVAGSLLLVVAFGILAVVIGGSSGSLLARSGYDAQLALIVGDYTVILGWAIAPAMVFATLKNVLNAVGRTGAIGWFSAGIVLGNLAGSIVLVHGVGAWPGLGVAGAAWATLAVNAGAAALLLAYVLRRAFIGFGGVRVRAALRNAHCMLALGWAAGGQQALESVLFVLVLYLLGLHSPLWLAAGAIVFAVMELNYALSSALGEVVSARIATLRAAGRGRTLRQVLRSAILVSGIAAMALALIVGLFPDAVAAVFSGPETLPAVRELMARLLWATAFFFVFDAWQIVFVHVLRGLRRTVLPMLLSSGCYWAIGIGGGVLLARFTGLGALGIWAGFCAGLTTAAMVLGIMVFRATARAGV